MAETAGGTHKIHAFQGEQKLEAAEPVVAAPTKEAERQVSQRAQEILKQLQESPKRGLFAFSWKSREEKLVGGLVDEINADNKKLKKLEKEEKTTDKAALKALKSQNKQKIALALEKQKATREKVTKLRLQLLRKIQTSKQDITDLQAVLARRSHDRPKATTRPGMKKTETDKKAERIEKSLAKANQLADVSLKNLIRLETEISPEKERDRYIAAVISDPHKYGKFATRDVFKFLRARALKNDEKSAEAVGKLKQLLSSLGNPPDPDLHLTAEDLIDSITSIINHMEVNVDEMVRRIKYLAPLALTGNRAAIDELVWHQATLERATTPQEQHFARDVRKQVAVILDNVWNETNFVMTSASFISLTIRGLIPPDVKFLPRYRDILRTMDFHFLERNPEEMRARVEFYLTLPANIRDALKTGDPQTREAVDRLKRIFIDQEAKRPEASKKFLGNLITSTREQLVELFGPPRRLTESDKTLLSEFRPDVYRELTEPPSRAPAAARVESRERPLREAPLDLYSWITKKPADQQFEALKSLRKEYESLPKQARPQESDDPWIRGITRVFLDFTDMRKGQQRLNRLPTASLRMPVIDRYRPGIKLHELRDAQGDLSALCRQVALGNKTAGEVIEFLQNSQRGNPNLLMAVVGDPENPYPTLGMIEEVINQQLRNTEPNSAEYVQALALRFNLHLDRALYLSHEREPFDYEQLVNDLILLGQTGNAQETAFALSSLRHAIEGEFLPPPTTGQYILLKGLEMQHHEVMPAPLSKETIKWMSENREKLQHMQKQIRENTGDPITQVKVLAKIVGELNARTSIAIPGSAEDLTFREWRKEIQALAVKFLDRGILRQWQVLNPPSEKSLTYMAGAVYLNVLLGLDEHDNVSLMIQMERILKTHRLDSKEARDYRDKFSELLDGATKGVVEEVGKELRADREALQAEIKSKKGEGVQEEGSRVKGKRKG